MSLFGDDSPPQIQYVQKPPPEPEFLDVIDEIARNEMITVTAADGKKRRVIRKLPPATPQDEAMLRQGEELMTTSLQRMRDLYAYNPAEVVNFRPIINTFADVNREQAEELGRVANIGNFEQEVQNFRTMKQTILDRDYAKTNRMLSDDLVKRGMRDSSRGMDERRLLAKDKALVGAQVDTDARIYGENLARQRLERNFMTYEANQQARSNRVLKAQTQYNLEREQLADLEQKRQTALQENAALFKIGAGIKGEDTNKALMSRAPEFALQDYGIRSKDQLERYNAGVRADMINYQNQLNAYNTKKPSFGDFMLQTGGRLGASYLTGNNF